MELKFDFDNIKFSASLGIYSIYKTSFDIKTNTITNQYKAKSEPHAIQIKIRGNNHDEFLKKMDNIDPKITFYEESSWIYPPIEKIKDKIK